MHGWVKLHRCLLEKNIFQNEKMLKVFMWCLMRANHKCQTVMVGRRQVDLQPGQFITGRKKASRELDMPPSTAWEYLKLLESNKTIDIYSDSKFSVVSVVNWASYQTDNQNSDSNSDSKSTANRQQIDTDKNVKNDKNDKKKHEQFFEEVWKHYPRKKGKGQISDRKKAELYGIGKEHMERAISRFKRDMEKEQRPIEKYPYGSTFFNGGYIDYLDENYTEDAGGESKWQMA